MKKLATPLMIAAALAGAPAIAAQTANPAASLSVTNSVRAHAATRHGAKLGTSTLTFGIIGAIVVLAAVLIATNDTPTSV